MFCSALFGGLIVFLATLALKPVSETDNSIQVFVSWLLEDEGQFQAVPFDEVVYAVSGRELLPVSIEEPEDALIAELDSVEGYECAVPLNASGEVQRSGYPDLRLVHQASGRVFYLDPKIYKAGSERSSFRTFYFEPKRETNKILEDASHLIVGISHSGKQSGVWVLDSWQVVDLADFKVRLKAEFQASNRDLYQESLLLGARSKAALTE